MPTHPHDTATPAHWPVVALVCTGAFVGQVDATIVQLALPTLGRVFDAPLQHISWVALAYLLAFVSFLPIFGRLCEMLGRKALYLVGYALFVAASALCGYAASLEQLLVFRFLQGIGGALLGANSISILVATVPSDQRGRALGYFAAAQAVGMSAGPVLGGLILDGLGWRWVFWLTVPFGLLAMLAGWLLLPQVPRSPKALRFDWGGMLLIGPALILVVSTLNHVSSWGLLSAPTLGSLGAAAVLLWLLVRRERSFASPLINPQLYRTPGFRSGALASVLSYALLYAVFFLMSFALEHGYGESPARAGLRLALIPVALGLTAPFSSELKRLLGARHVGVVGMLLCVASVLLLMRTLGLSPDHHLYDTLAFVLVGIGLGMFIAPNTHATLAAAPAELSGVVGSQLNLMRVLGTSLGVAVGATLLSARLAADPGAAHGWMSASSDSLLAAVRESLPILLAIAVAAAFAARATAGHADRPTP
jgi:EmrB/QacA subfamily drug resistance transporter